MSIEAFLLTADLLPEAMLLVSADGTIHAANRAAGEYVGRTACELHGRPFAEFVAGAPEAVADYLRACQPTHVTPLGSLRIVRASGPPVVCRCEGAVYRAHTDDAPALVLFRLSSGLNANGFAAVSQRIEALSDEARRRPLAGSGASTERTGARGSEFLTGESAPAGRGLQVLVVDDNVDAADSLAVLLRASGHTVVGVVYDGPTAVEAILSTRPAVVVLDIGLPGLSGYDVAQRVRAQRMAPQPYLIAVTGYGLEADKVKAHEVGIDTHVVKPVDPERLQEILAVIAASMV
ncbi:response regulator [Fimbriiglobus ruber]|uniref:Chemotaxis protein methyltransferase CheR n=1 Tax=Fimbriiglobus ruber TaxID=1908690 RepID=A0A225DAD5_9BACT|nr:response regulator [Fimbriiglobus ruber]OWK38550.1 Chemotaxis protein methyltransferase CheR [Fimbriiglobus ruber]